MPAATIILESGGPPQAVVNAATATGVGASSLFTVSPGRDGATPHVLTLEAVGAGAVPTTVTANLTASSDGGTTYQTYGSNGSIALVATSTGTIAIISNLVSGLIYQLSIGTLTLGSATSVTVWAGVS